MSGQWIKIIVKFMTPRHTPDPTKKKGYIQLHPPQAKKCIISHIEIDPGSSSTTQTGHIHTKQHLNLSFSLQWRSVLHSFDICV